jgi:hypothetical protein
MHQLRRTHRLLVAVPTVALLAISLVGCGDALKNKVEDDLKDQGISADLDDPNNISVEGTDGGFTTGKLPKSFPTDEVPVVDGEILAGTFTKNPESWNVTIRVGDAGGDKAGAYSAAEDKLTSGGLETVTPSADNGTGIFGEYTSASYTVDLAVTDSNGIVVNYTVSPK